MRKVMLLAAVVAMVLAAAAPAFAQASAVGGSVQYVDCDQIQAAATGQYNVANDQDLAALAQWLGVSQNQVSACYGSIAAGDDVNINTASETAIADTVSPPADDGGSASAAAGGEGPATGGASLFALGAGCRRAAGGRWAPSTAHRILSPWGERTATRRWRSRSRGARPLPPASSWYRSWCLPGRSRRGSTGRSRRWESGRRPGRGRQDSSPTPPAAGPRSLLRWSRAPSP